MSGYKNGMPETWFHRRAPACYVHQNEEMKGRVHSARWIEGDKMSGVHTHCQGKCLSTQESQHKMVKTQTTTQVLHYQEKVDEGK